MSERSISPETLNAYVDGELDPKVAADVARAIAYDPTLAREVAALSRLRVTVAEAFAAPKFDLPAQPQRRPRKAAITVGIACTILIVGALMLVKPDHSGGSGWLSRAWEVHGEWSIDVLPGSKPAALDVTYTEALLADAYVPDLTASRLNLVHAGVVSFTNDRQALLAGYRGSRGCKISLLIFPSPVDLEENPGFFRNGNREGYGWRTAHLGYLVLSDGMDSDRFRLLAESIHDVSRQHLPFDTQTRMALRSSRDQSLPCTA
jgi:hypothetical protein